MSLHYFNYKIYFIYFQELENQIRNTLNEIYFGKTKDIVHSLRSLDSLENATNQKAMMSEIKNVLNQRGDKKQ